MQFKRAVHVMRVTAVVALVAPAVYFAAFGWNS